MGGNAIVGGTFCGAAGGVIEAAPIRSNDSCRCFCWACNLVLSRSLSAMISPLAICSPSLTLRSSGSEMLTVMFKRLGVVVSVCPKGSLKGISKCIL